MELTQIQVRVLACLVEKKATTPDQYPLTVNAVKTACNQKTNRDPVVSYHEGEVGHALRELEGLKLVVQSWSSRSARWEHRMVEGFDIRVTDMAVLCALMLRGPQTAGEIRAHCHRIHAFDGIDDVEYVLDRLATREVPMVVKLARQPGHKEDRYAHLIAGEPTIPKVVASRISVSPLEQRVTDLEAEVAQLRACVRALGGDVDE